LRLVRHVAPGQANSKALALRRTVRSEFDKHRNETDEVAIENAKLNAVRALSNYMLVASAPKDPKAKQAIKDFHGRSVQAAKDDGLRS
jgi:polynucleotide 5'-kinase involved in rRNA processing